MVPHVGTVAPIVSTQFDTIEESMKPFLAFMPELAIGFFEKMGMNITPEMREEMLTKMRGQATENASELRALREQAEEKVIENIVSSMGSFNPGVLEKEQASQRSIPTISFGDYHLEAMTHLLGQLYLTVKETPLLRGRIPVVIPVGRSISWLVKLHEMLDPTLQTGVEFKHILASGLNGLRPTPSQKIGYKGYLDGLGFEGLEDGQHELLFLDVSESGQTLTTMKSLVEELYSPLLNHTQHLAILYDEETTDLPCARIIRMSDDLRPVMFAKHSEKQYYCPHPTFYPHDWETPEILDDFVVPKGARDWEGKMQDWLSGEEVEVACRKIKEILEPED